MFDKTKKTGISDKRMREIATTHDAVDRARGIAQGTTGLAQSADKLGTIGRGKTIL